MQSPLLDQEQTDDDQVTAIISHLVRPGREQGYEEWVHGIGAAAKTFEGHQGVNIICPCDHSNPEYVVILRFDRYANLKKWLESDIRREWIERLGPLIQKSEDIQTLTGLETWFHIPGKPPKAPPPRRKMVLVTWLGVFVTATVVGEIMSLVLSVLPPLVGRFITMGIVVVLLTYFVMPRLVKLFHPWLYPNS